MKVLLIGVAGGLGAMSRYAVDTLVSERFKGHMPWGTIVVNVTGCFLLGLALAATAERLVPHPHVRTAMTVGFLGAYTTFSTFAVETMRLAEGGAAWFAAANVLGSVGASITAVILGTWLGRAI